MCGIRTAMNITVKYDEQIRIIPEAGHCCVQVLPVKSLFKPPTEILRSGEIGFG
jgi:hypothetical protein